MSAKPHPPDDHDLPDNYGKGAPGGIAYFLECVNVTDKDDWIDQLPQLYEDWKRTQEERR